MLCLVALPSITHADLTLIPPPGPVNQTQNDRLTQVTCNTSSGVDCTTLEGNLNYLWDKFEGYLGLLALVAVVLLIWNGIKYVTSQGDPKKVGEARTAILQIVLAVALITASTAVVSLIYSLAVTLGTSSTSLSLGKTQEKLTLQIIQPYNKNNNQLLQEDQS